ncbi:MAG: excinuclease ABC subunit UvrC [Spirochaetaceae bacterium]|nr:excinuclease ABC subunit UvrC [Spirochaetaceae bacterium]
MKPDNFEGPAPQVQSREPPGKPGQPEHKKQPHQLSPQAAKNAKFRAFVRQAPEAPGVYIMRDESGTIIYVGKAKILRNRLLSYFTGKKEAKTRHLVSKIATIEWVLAGNEYDALLLENNLIKEHSPRYNISLKDGKTYPSIRITNEEFPRVFRTRRIINDGSEYFGPFPSAETIDIYLDLIKRLFPLRRCVALKKRDAPCMYYHIGRCPAPCAGKITHADYMERVEEIRKLLSGDTASLEANLKEKMGTASAEFRFEEAARLRDAIKAVEQFVGRSNVQDFDIEARDYIAWHGDGDLLSIVVFRMRDGRMKGRDSYLSPLYSTEEEAIQTFLTSYYDKTNPPPEQIYLMKSAAPAAVRKYIRSLGAVAGGKGPAHRVAFLLPREQPHTATMQLALQNAREELIKRRRETGDLQALMELRSLAGLSDIPARIEGFDIAHLAGKYTVASLVSFRNGVADKKNYRYFRIKSLAGAVDDFGAIREAVARRYTRLINEEAELPNLVLVDGGAGQVSAAKGILDELGLDCDLAGLAKKNEEIYLPGRSEPIVLPKDSPALRVLVAVRDETHRFATGLSKKLRNKDLRFTRLQAVPGIGEKRAKKLMKEYGSLEAIAISQPEEIARRAGIKLEIALQVREVAVKSYGMD